MKTWLLIAITALGFSGSFAFADARICVNGICIGDGGRDHGHDHGRDHRRGDGWDHGRPGYGSADYITCESIGDRYNSCRFDNFPCSRCALDPTALTNKLQLWPQLGFQLEQRLG